MTRYMQGFTKVVRGFRRTEAKSAAEATEKFADGDCDEFDNKSEYTELGEIAADGDAR